MQSAGQSLLKTVGRVVSRAQELTSLQADLFESETAYLLVFDAPGAAPGDVQVRFQDGAVDVRIDRFREFREGYDMRIPGRGLALDGRVRLPRDAAVDAEEATAVLQDDGTLHVTLPKETEAAPATGAQPEQISIDSEH